MNKLIPAYFSERFFPIVLSLFVSTAVLLGLLNQASAQSESQSLQVSKTVLASDGVPGGMVQYAVVLTNSGTTSVTINLTDTFPVSTTFMSETLERSCDFDVYWGDRGIVSRNSLLQPGQVVTATYQLVVDENIPADRVTGSDVVSELKSAVLVEDTDGGEGVTDIAVTTVVTDAEQIFLPSLFVTDASTPTNRSAGSSQIEVADVTYAGDQSPAESWSAWNYEENFSPPCEHDNWRIVRQDTDEVINSISAHDGYLDLRMEGRFDYMITSNLAQLPPAPYRLTARMRLEDADPRHTGGIILGGDYDGTSACPESIDEDNSENSKYGTCFTEYYRFMFIAGNVSNQFTTQIKRIDEHSETNNSPIGESLATGQLTVLKTNSDWITWNVDVHQDGTIRWYADGDLVHEVTDTAFLENNYFGFWSSTSDASFSNTQIDWVTVEPIE